MTDGLTSPRPVRWLLLSPGVDTIQPGDEFWDGREWRPERSICHGLTVEADMSPIRRRTGLPAAPPQVIPPDSDADLAGKDPRSVARTLTEQLGRIEMMKLHPGNRLRLMMGLPLLPETSTTKPESLLPCPKL